MVSELLERHDPSSIALADPERATAVSYAELMARVGVAAERLRRRCHGGLLFQITTNGIESIVLYLASLEAECPVCLLEPGPANRLQSLLETYCPEAVLLPAAMETPAGFALGESLEYGYRMVMRSSAAERPKLNPALALLLTTSGSTGNPRLVRLTRRNLIANATSISAYLNI